MIEDGVFLYMKVAAAIFTFAIWFLISVLLEQNIERLEKINIKEYDEAKYFWIAWVKNMVSGPFILLKLLRK